MINTWEEFQNIVASDQYRSWAFRGQEDASWKLESTLSRYLKTFRVHPSVWSNQEKRVFRIFKRKAHLYLQHMPKDEEIFEWLSLMQHHGAPTRLLDFTWSPYIAAFFALETATNNAAIWAVYPIELRKKQNVSEQLSKELDNDKIGIGIGNNYNSYFINNEYSFLTFEEPYRMNNRLTAQSGTFIIPSRIDMTIDEIIEEVIDKDNKLLVKFELNTAQMRHETLRKLYNMNITNAALFPDLDGLAKSMALEFEMHHAYDPISGKGFEGI